MRSIAKPTTTRRRRAVSFAAATTASLLFPFAPHLALGALRGVTGERVWEEPWPRGGPGCWSATP